MVPSDHHENAGQEEERKPLYLPGQSNLPRVVLIGGGFGGLSFLKRIDHRAFETVLIDCNNFHQFQPLLYQVGTSALEPDNIVFPYRKQLHKMKNSYFVYGKAIRVDVQNKTVYTDAGYLSYDKLVVGTGTIPDFFGMEGVAKHAIPLKDIRDALNLRHFMLGNLEKAAVSRDEEERNMYTNFVIVGGGPTGVELAGALAEFKKYILPRDYPEYSSEIMQVYLLEASDRLLGGMSEKASRLARKHLTDMGVDVRTEEPVEDFDGRCVVSKRSRIPARNFVWAAGVKGILPLGFPEAIVGKNGRIRVDERLRIEGMADEFAIGDVADLVNEEYPKGHPQLAQVAIQQGDHVARSLNASKGKKDPGPFRYRDKGVLATIGKKKAVAEFGNYRFDGFFAWLMWSLVHLFQISGFRNKFLVGLNWMWSYFTYEKGARLIIRKYRKR